MIHYNNDTIPPPRSNFRVALPLLIAWEILYTTIILGSIFAQNSLFLDIIKVFSIFLSFVYAAISFPHDRLLILALFFTSLADLFLAFDNTSILGLVVFVIAQLTHLVRLDWERYREAIFLFCAVATVMITLVLIFQFTSPIYVVCTCYGGTLTLNLMASWHWKSSRPRNLRANLALSGFLLFAACDIWTSVSFLALTGLFSSNLYAPANFLAWFFYYPAQILISNSAKCATIVPKEGKR